MYRLIVLVFLVTSYKAADASDTLNFKTVNEATYRYYMEQKWDSVIHIGNEAINCDIDYYYLRMRIGIAYFAKKQYRSAESHFIKALQFNSSDDVAKEYLYYCYIYSEQYNLAGKLSCSFSDSLTHKLKTAHHKLIDVIDADAGEKISSNTLFYSNANFFQLEAGNSLGKEVSLFTSYTFFNQTAYRDNVYQSDLYITGGIPLPCRWLFTPAVHLLLINAQPFNYNSVQWAPSLAIQKSYNKFDVGFLASYSDIEFKTQLQQGASLTVFPVGNTKLSLNATVLSQEGSSQNVQPAGQCSVAYTPFSALTLYFGCYAGNTLYINQYNGYLVDNAATLTKSMFTVSASVAINRHFTVFALYQYENTTNRFDNTPFHYTTVMGGLKFYL